MIKTKLDKKGYLSMDDVDRDVQQMLNNAIKFNGKEGEIGIYTTNMANIWEDILAKKEDQRVKKKPRLA